MGSCELTAWSDQKFKDHPSRNRGIEWFCLDDSFGLSIDLKEVLHAGIVPVQDVERLRMSDMTKPDWKQVRWLLRGMEIVDYLQKLRPESGTYFGNTFSSSLLKTTRFKLKYHPGSDPKKHHRLKWNPQSFREASRFYTPPSDTSVAPEKNG